MKIKMKDFKFKVGSYKIKQDAWKSYIDLLSKKDKTDLDKNYIKIYRKELKVSKYALLVTHIPTKIVHVFELPDLNYKRKDYIDKMILEIQLVRKKYKDNKIESKQFGGADYCLLAGTFIKPNQVNEIGKRVTWNDPYNTKVPSSKKENYIGIELEFNKNDKYNMEHIADAFRAANLSKYVQVGTDGTCGYEVRVLLKEKDFIDPLLKILSILNKMKFKTNANCGTHVHIDMRNRDHKQVYSNFFKTQDFMRKFLKKDRLENEYCKYNKESEFDGQLKLNDRRYGINAQAYSEHKTLEIRMHHGTLNKKELIPWVNLLLKVANYTGPVVNKVSDLAQAVLEYKLEGSFSEELETKLQFVK